RLVEHVPPRPQRPRFVVTATTVDQNLAAVDLQQPAMDAELELVGFRIVVIGHEPMAVLFQMRLSPGGKQLAWAVNWTIGLFDARNGGFSDLENRHCRYRSGWIDRRPLGQPWSS